MKCKAGYKEINGKCEKNKNVFKLLNIEKSEIKYILFAFVLAVLIFGVIIPFLISKGVENINPWWQFIIFNIGVFFFFQVFLKSISTREKIGVKVSIGLLLLFMALDILCPPMMISLQGNLLTGPILSASASDYILGSLLINLGMSGFLVYAVTYIIIPFVLLFLSAILLKNLVKEI